MVMVISDCAESGFGVTSVNTSGYLSTGLATGVVSRRWCVDFQLYAGAPPPSFFRV